MVAGGQQECADRIVTKPIIWPANWNIQYLRHATMAGQFLLPPKRFSAVSSTGALHILTDPCIWRTRFLCVCGRGHFFLLPHGRWPGLGSRHSHLLACR